MRKLVYCKLQMAQGLLRREVTTFPHTMQHYFYMQILYTNKLLGHLNLNHAPGLNIHHLVILPFYGETLTHSCLTKPFSQLLITDPLYLNMQQGAYLNSVFKSRMLLTLTFLLSGGMELRRQLRQNTNYIPSTNLSNASLRGYKAKQYQSQLMFNVHLITRGILFTKCYHNFRNLKCDAHII